jgi:hypothetical protein
LIVAGGAWGLTMAAVLNAMALRQCGLPCPDDVAFVTLVCIGTGLLTIGPLAALATPSQ